MLGSTQNSLKEVKANHGEYQFKYREWFDLPEKVLSVCHHRIYLQAFNCFKIVLFDCRQGIRFRRLLDPN